ncbi:hypothetical protein OAH06_03750 [Akkermansiaceae bacterium]|nr:hypothetical protein [Akkermansiaceae bacterium]
MIIITTSDDYFLEHIHLLAAKNPDFNYLVIAPGTKFSVFKRLKNVNLITALGFLDFQKHRRYFEKAVGFVPHKNKSFPTSLNLFVENLIPVVSTVDNLSAQVIKLNKLGSTIESIESLTEEVSFIQKNYTFFQENCQMYKSTLTWDEGSEMLKNSL